MTTTRKFPSLAVVQRVVDGDGAVGPGHPHLVEPGRRVGGPPFGNVGQGGGEGAGAGCADLLDQDLTVLLHGEHVQLRPGAFLF